MTDDSIKYTERAVALVDILGFKNVIESLQADNNYLKVIHRALRRIKLIEAWAASEHTFLKELEVSVFSDNIAISGEVSQMPEIVLTVGYLQADLLSAGMLTRGGITAGMLHHADGLIFGAALVTADEMEKTKAIFPRVIIDPNLIENVGPRAKRFLKFVDGWWSIDPFRFGATVGDAAELAADGYDPHALYYEEVRAQLCKQMHNADGNSRVGDKIRWMVQRFNEAILTHDYLPCPAIGLDE